MWAMLKTRPQLIPLGPMARMLRVTAKWLRSEAEAGRIPCLRAGKALLFNADTVESLLLARAENGGAGGNIEGHGGAS